MSEILDLKQCCVCPRHCKTNRFSSVGFCQCSSLPRVARAALHFWEEPCISGEKGSGTIFFSGCNLKCVYCQNRVLSHENFGKEISVERLGQIMLELQAKGANNINLVSPTQYVPQIIDAYNLIKGNLHIPIVYNTGGYESLDTIKALDKIVDVYLPDFKYFDPNLALILSNAPDYFDNVLPAIKEMVLQTGKCIFDENGIIKKGTIIRHLVLPGMVKNSLAVMKCIYENFGADVMVSIMSQYVPDFYEGNIESLKRTLTQKEYDQVVDYAIDLGIDGYIQELSSADTDYTPVFNLEGV